MLGTGLNEFRKKVLLPPLADGFYRLPDGRYLQKEGNVYRIPSKKGVPGGVFCGQFMYTSKSKDARELKELVKQLRNVSADPTRTSDTQ